MPSPGDLPNPGIELGSPPLQVDSLPAELLGYTLETMGNTRVSVQDGPDQIFMSSRSCKSLALRKEAKRAQLSEHLQRQRSWRFSFQNPSRRSLLLSYITRHKEPPAEGNEMPHCWSGSVLKEGCNESYLSTFPNTALHRPSDIGIC